MAAPVAFEITSDYHDDTWEAQPSEIAELVLGPFSRIPKLEFAGVEVGCEALLTVNLRNPTDASQCVIVILPKDFLERGFSLNADKFEIPPYSKAELEIRFKPVKELQCRDTIYVKDKFRNQKSQFQLTSRAIGRKMTRKRKTWTMNKKPVVVPTCERNVRIESLPPKTPVITAPESSVEHVGSTSKNPTLNVTFPVVSVTTSTPTEMDATYCMKPEPIRELSTVFDDSLEEGGPRAQEQNEIGSHAQFTSRTDTFSYDSVELNTEVNKENPASVAKKRRMFDISFSDIDFDNLTPDRTETRSCLRSIENVAHNSSTPKLPPSMVKYTETTYNFTSVRTIKQEFVSPQPGRGNDYGSMTRDASTGASTQPCKDQFSIKLEPVTPKFASSRAITVTTDSTQINVKTQPIFPHANWVDNQADSKCAFKIPPPVCFKEEAFTPIPQSESMRKLAIAFAISPPKETLSSRRKSLFGKVSMCSTPRRKEPVVRLHKAHSSSQMVQAVKQEAEESILSRSWNLNASDTSNNRAKVPARPKETARGTLSPKSLVAFKKNVRVHVPPKNLSRPSSANSDSSISSEPFVTIDMFTRDVKEPVYNLDIYGATTMSDPFARCAIHPLEFIEKQGRQLIKWVNSVLTPPEEYSAYEAGVDVASLWKKSVSSNNVPLPPSRETVSSKFHKNEMHLLNLRKTAHQIFKSTSITETLYKIYSKINVGYISVKDDIDLHCDQGARCHLVQMLMYYNPLWLRVGLEAIYGKDIPLQPRHTVIGLMHFIKNNLLSDKYIAEKNSYQNIQHLKMPKFKKEMNDFIVFKFFSLVFFLDIAKQKAIVPYDPCLFNKNSPIKESEGMINEFIKEFIKCVGHMKRNLASMGFVVSHKQTAVDEYDFAVQTHLDLRDGANITRLMEIILQKKQLIKKLRLPAISRLQKFHNVKLAFSALAEKGVTIVDVLPFDVVDGHHEKIMSFLWQILHKFLKPRMEKSAVIIQKWWRKKSLKLEIARRIHFKKGKRVETAAVKIQSLWQGYILRKNFPNMKTDLERRKTHCRLLKENAAITIQRWYRKSKQHEAEECEVKCKAVVPIQLHCRALVKERTQHSEYLLIENFAVKKQKQEYEKKHKAVVTIQQHYRALVEGRKQRDEYLLMNNSAVVIQRWYRATVEMKKEKQKYEAKRKAVVTIQQHYRAVVEGRKQHHEYLLMRNSAVVVQRWYRATVVEKNRKQEYETKRKAAVTIQQHYRSVFGGRKQRNEYLLTKKSAVVIQQWYRATVAMKIQKHEYETKRKAVLTIQQHYRAVVEGRKQRNEYLLMKNSAVVIQHWYQATVAMKKQKQEYETKRKAVVTVQQHYRAVVEGRKQRDVYLLMTKSAVVILCWYRATIAMKKQKQEYETKRKAVVTIQQHYRAVVEGRKQRNEYLLMTKSAVVIQCWYRATVVKKKRKQEYETKRKAVVTIQQLYRAVVNGKKQRSEYLLMKKSAVVIQRWYRATVAMKKQKQEYETKREAVVTIQQNYRAVVEGRKQRDMYLLMKKSAAVIQRWYRATVVMKKQKQEYETKRKAVVTIQQHYRAVVQGRKQRNGYLLMTNSAVVIQCWYRATVVKKKRKQEYETKRKAVVTIQQLYRAVVNGKKQRSEYLLMKKSAVVIQRWYRATVVMKKQKQEYETKRKAVVTIQQHYRAVVQGRKQRNEYLLMTNSAVVIQCWYRTTIAMKKQKQEYETKRKAVITIQQLYRAVVEGRKQRDEHLLVKNSAVVIQRWFRASVEMKKEKQEYEAKRKAVVTIQQHYRAVVEGRQQRNEYLLMKNSAVVIQCWYRAKVVKKKRKQEYEKKRKAVVTIQKLYHAVVNGRKQRSEYLLMKNSAVVIQLWYRAAVATKKQKQEYEIKRKAVVTIQQHYRAVVEGRKQRDKYLLMKKSAAVIQHWYRATVSMKKQKQECKTKRKAVVTIQQHYRAVVEGRNQLNEYLLKKNSAVVIQRWYRATVAMKRQKLEHDTKYEQAEASGGAVAPHKDMPTLLQNYDRAIDFILSPAVTKSLNRTYVAFKNLDFATQYSPILCENLAEPASTKVFAVIYYFLDIESRSNAYQSVFGHGLNVLLNLTTYDKTYNAVWENTMKYDGINVLLHLQGKFLEKKEELFCRAATIIWLLSCSPEQVEVIKGTTEFVRRMTYYSKKVLPANKNVQAKKRKPVLPSLESDWGYSQGRKGHREFPARIDAISALLDRYNITL